MAENFEKTLLSPVGFFVSVDDKKVALPDDTFVPDGEEFRNSFHLHPLARTDLFVPCGGRPAAININNWKMLLDDKGTAKFKIIVEGASLFITEQARLRLEESGVIVIKDASANKGGLTSSSLEVLAALALTDDEFDKHMRVKNHTIPDFMKSYIESVLETILNRVPAPYLDAIVASKVATNYIYRHGMDANEIDFFNYLKKYIS